jgi:hypothetical protein
MNIQYIDPLSRGFARMKRALFKPFDLQKWIIVGFTAFLAGLTKCGGGGHAGLSRGRGKVDPEVILYFPQRVWEWLTDHPVWAAIIAFGVLLVFVFVVFISWLSARGKFMFLDNVVHNRSQVVAPWKEYGNEGNSYFLFNFLLGILVLAIIVAYLIYSVTSLQVLYESSRNMRALILPAILAGLGLITILAACGFIGLLLRDFIVPIMYRDRVSTSKAIQKFFPLFLSHFLYFIGYGLFVLCLSLMIVIGIVIAGFATCCIGFVLLAIPYINSVILLPVSYTMRAFGVEFLEQFGPDYQIFPRPGTNSFNEPPVVA